MVPPAPPQERVYVVVAVRVTDCAPDKALIPAHPFDATQREALVETQVSVVDALDVVAVSKTFWGLAVKVNVGAAGVGGGGVGVGVGVGAGGGGVGVGAGGGGVGVGGGGVAGGGVGEQYAGKVKSKLLRSLNFKTFAQKRASISVTAKANGGKLYAASAIDTKHASRILSVFIFVYYKLCFPCSLCINLVWISYRF